MRIGQVLGRIISRTLQFPVDLVLDYFVPEHHDIMTMHKKLANRSPEYDARMNKRASVVIERMRARRQIDPKNN